MSSGEDLTAQALEEVLDGRSLQSHAVILSTASSAAEWAAAGAPNGSVVVADYQIAPRGRAGRPWKVVPGSGLGCALVLRPQLPAQREGWLYTVSLTALADVCGEQLTIQWPDEIQRDGVMAAAVGVQVRLGVQGVKWAVVNLLVVDAQAPRGTLLQALLRAIEDRLASEPEAVLEDYRRLCTTLGRNVRVRLLGGVARLEGTALAPLDDGALMIEKSEGRQVALRPQDVSSIEEL